MKNMQILFLVLSQYEKLEKLLVELNNIGVKGATVINSTGMAQVLSHETDAFLGSLRAFLTPEREDNRTVIMVLEEDKVESVKKVIHRVIGSLNKPGTGILFVTNAVYVEGIENL